MRRNRAAALILILAFAVSCASNQAIRDAGADPLALRAEQTYIVARETANLLFSIEDENEALIESKLPGTHGLVEKLRVRVREDLPKLLRAIDTYKAARDEGKNALLIALALVDEFLAEVQTILGNSQKVVAP